jgi:exo-beta-1,3-glucanase (GH17 family)
LYICRCNICEVFENLLLSLKLEVVKKTVFLFIYLTFLLNTYGQDGTTGTLSGTLEDGTSTITISGTDNMPVYYDGSGDPASPVWQHLETIVEKSPEINITHIPQIGTGESAAEGKVVWSELSASNAKEYAVIAMLLDEYVKPTWENYLSDVDEFGNFLINITTDPNDNGVDKVTFYFVERKTFAGVSGGHVNASYMAGKYLGEPLTISRREFWEKRPQQPIPNILPGFVTAGNNITLSCQSGGTIYYTLDGSDPISSSTTQTYNAETSFTVPTTGSLLVKAITELSGFYSYPASFVWLPQEPLTTPLWGLNVSLALNGEYFGYPLSEEITRTRMQAIAPLTKWVRTFGTLNNGHEYINKIAKDELGLHTMIGVFVTANTSDNNAQIQGLRQILETGPAPNLIVVGNECSLAKVNPAILASCIDDVRKILKEHSLVIPVGSADIAGAEWSQLVLDKLDFTGVNIYPGTWDNTSENQMIEVLSKSFTNTVNAFPSKLVLLTETGTPHSGAPYVPPGATQMQTPSISKAASYFDGFLKYIKKENIPAFYFEAYDEPIKSQNGGHQIEQYFGLMDGNMEIHPFYQFLSIIRPNYTTNPILYPNPVSDIVSFKGLPAGATIQIMDVLGKIVKTYENAPETIDVSYLHKGTYFVNVNDRTLKMIKK